MQLWKGSRTKLQSHIAVSLLYFKCDSFLITWHCRSPKGFMHHTCLFSVNHVMICACSLRRNTPAVAAAIQIHRKCALSAFFLSAQCFTCCSDAKKNYPHTLTGLAYSAKCVSNRIGFYISSSKQKKKTFWDVSKEMINFIWMSLVKLSTSSSSSLRSQM